MENNTIENEKTIPLVNLLYKNIVLIIMVVVLTALIGFGYSIVNVKPTYTAHRSFILRMIQAEANENGQSALGKLHIKHLEEVLTFPEHIKKANEVYKERQNGTTEIKESAVSINYNDESLIFTLSYTDENEKDAAAKLHAIYLVANEKLAESLTVDSVELIDIDNVNINVETETYEGLSYTKDDGYLKFILIGAVAGFVISICVILIKYALDNTIRSKEELEEVTGASVLAFISKNKN